MINNFAFTAYNNRVEEISIVQNGYDGLYMSYLYKKVKDRFSFLPASCDFQKSKDGAEILFRTEKEYCPYVRKFTERQVADVLSIGYKYAYFEKNLLLPLLSPQQRRLLITALVAADYPDDHAYIARKLKGDTEYCLDGVYHFRLQELKKRWQGVVDYIPADMNVAAMDGFIEFLVEDGQGKLFLKDGKAYDENYRPINRSLLTGVQSLIGEILLSQAERVYCFGETDGDTKAFLEKYYGEKASFC